MVVLLSLVFLGLVFYFLTEVLSIKSDKLIGPPLLISIVVVLLAGLSYYLVWEKSIYVEIKADDLVIQKRTIEFNDDILSSDGVFVFTAVTIGIPFIDYSQQVKDFLSNNELKLCRNYMSQTIGTGRYKKEARPVTICINKKGARWNF